MTPLEEDKYINDLAVAGFEASEKEGKDLGKLISGLEKRIKNKKKFQKFADKMLFENQDKYYGIFSCCEDWDSIVMWSHYALNHSGFCVGFWVEEMKDQEFFGKLGQVVYRHTYPIIKPRAAKKDDLMMENSFIETHTKAKEWEYESEYRFMINRFPMEFKPRDRIKTVPNKYIAEVILGITISSHNKNEIINICESKQIPVYQAKKVSFKFKITREKIK